MKTEEREVGGLEFDEYFRGQYRSLVCALYLLTASQVEAEELAQENHGPPLRALGANQVRPDTRFR